jgi:hypothetical protein
MQYEFVNILVMQTNLYSSTTTLDQVHADLIARHAAAQTDLNATNPPIGGLIGSTWNGTNWG